MSSMNFRAASQISTVQASTGKAGIAVSDHMHALPQLAAGIDTMTAHDFAVPAQIGTVLPATKVSANFAATLPSVTGGSASHLLSVAATTPGGGVHVFTHVS